MQACRPTPAFAPWSFRTPPALEDLFVALGYPAPPQAIHQRLTRLRSDPTYAAWVAVPYLSDIPC